MIRTMMFIDGTWLWANIGRLGAPERQDFKPDYAKLPRVLSAEVARSLPGAEPHIVRIYLFGSYPDNHAPEDTEFVERQKGFLHMLKEEFHYEVTLFPIDFRGRRVRRADRDPADEFEPREKCVDISLATSLLYLAALPNAYDVAIALIGDRDFVPVLQRVRDLGKRVAIASIRGACATELWSPRDEARVKDFDVVWLDDVADQIELRYEPHLLECESPAHVGPRLMSTTFYPRRNQKFYCDACRRQDLVRLNPAPAPSRSNGAEVLRGLVVRILEEKGYGFIRAENQLDYFFHLKDLAAGVLFSALAEGQEVVFQVRRESATPGESGAAREVRPLEAEPSIPAP